MQFEAWKEKHQGHPDKEGFANYLKNGQEMRATLLLKKEQMQKAKSLILKLDAEEEELKKQLSDWDKQLDTWKEQHQGHPDKEGFANYIRNGQETRATLLLKKEQIQKAKALILKLDAEEEEFKKLFSDWDKQLEEWKEQHQGHPNKEGFANYMKNKQETRATLLLKKEQMQKANALILKLDAEEEEFKKQLSDWDKQLDTWKEQHQGHPDKEGFANYIRNGQETRATLLLKKEQIQKAKALILKLDAEEEEFKKLFSDWDKQLEEWKEQHQGHPNKEGFANYMKYKQETRATLLLKKEQMQKANALILKKKDEKPNPPPSEPAKNVMSASSSKVTGGAENEEQRTKASAGAANEALAAPAIKAVKPSTVQSGAPIARRSSKKWKPNPKFK